MSQSKVDKSNHEAHHYQNSASEIDVSIDVLDKPFPKLLAISPITGPNLYVKKMDRSIKYDE
ncbi:MAG: hypothetical protein ACW99Q_04770, partial [Candidatus Kariarchaeaceae archaeon]